MSNSCMYGLAGATALGPIQPTPSFRSGPGKEPRYASQTQLWPCPPPFPEAWGRSQLSAAPCRLRALTDAVKKAINAAVTVLSWHGLRCAPVAPRSCWVGAALTSEQWEMVLCSYEEVIMQFWSCFRISRTLMPIARLRHDRPFIYSFCQVAIL